MVFRSICTIFAPVTYKTTTMMDDKNYPITDGATMMATEPAAATLSESVRQTGLLGQVMALSRKDKAALVSYLKKDIGQDEPFKNDEFGRITLTPQMRAAADKAAHDYEEGRCLTEDDFKQRFARWL